MVVNEVGKDATLRDYVRVVQRRKWIVLGAAAVLMALALAYSLVKTPLYEASAQLIYETQLNVADPLSVGGSVDPAQMQVELNSVAAAIASPELIDAAGKTLRRHIPLTSYTVSAAPYAQSGQTDNSTVVITAISPRKDRGLGCERLRNGVRRCSRTARARAREGSGASH